MFSVTVLKANLLCVLCSSPLGRAVAKILCCRVYASTSRRIEPNWIASTFLSFFPWKEPGGHAPSSLGEIPAPRSFVTAPTWVSVVDGAASWTIGSYWFAITWQGGYIGGHTINFGRIYMKGSSVPLRERLFCYYHQHARRDFMCKLAIPFCGKRWKNPWKVVFVESRS